MIEACGLAIKEFVQTAHLLLTAEKKIFAGWKVCLMGCRGLLAVGSNAGPILVQVKGSSTTHRLKMSGISSSR